MLHTRHTLPIVTKITANYYWLSLSTAWPHKDKQFLDRLMFCLQLSQERFLVIFTTRKAGTMVCLQDVQLFIGKYVYFAKPPASQALNWRHPRTVVLSRGDDGNLGISIKGGREHNLPILVSRVTSGCVQARYMLCKVQGYKGVTGVML